MIPILYAKNTTDFSNNGLGFLKDAIKATVTEERNGSYELSLQYPTVGQWYELITDGCIIKAKPNETSKPQLFRIYKSSKPLNGVVTYSAEHISYDLNGLPIAGLSAINTTPQEAITQALKQTPLTHSFTAESDILTPRSISIAAPCSVRSLLGGQAGSVLDTWGGEYEFDNFVIKLHAHRGNDNGVSIEYGKNLEDIKQESNIAECYSHIMPYAAYQKEPEEYDETAEPETVYVYLSEKILAIPGAENLGHIKVYPVDFSDRFEEGAEYTEAALRELAEDFLSDTDLGTPKVSLSVSFVQLWQTEEYKNIAPLERVELCDLVTVKFPQLGVESKSKVIKTVFDVLGERYESIDLGDAKDNLANAVIETEKAIKTIKKATDRLESHIKRTDERITLEVLHIVENEKELYARIELTEDAITSEVSRATDAEGKLSSRITQTADSITAEVTRATNAETELSGKIELTAESLTTTFESKVKEETDRAEAAEKELSSTITQTAESITTEITAKITTETERAEKKEEELSSRITQTADSITAEVTRATNAEAELSGKIELTAESLTTTFESKVKEETDRAEAAEKELSSTITQTAESLTSTFTATITETTETLTGKIDEEAARAGKAEETLTSTISQTAEEIATEVSRATDAEGKLSSRITQTADSITAEVTRATNAESNLSTKITQTVNAIRLSVSSKESGDETETTVSITNGTTTLNSVKITGTTAKQAAAIIADSVKGITLSYTSTTSNNQTTSTLTLKNGSATLGTATVVGTTATQAATIAADAVKGITLTVSNSTTGASSTLTLKSGSTTLSSGTIEFTGLVTFSNLTDGKTQISGNNITTGKISADRIDVSTLYVDRVYSGTTASRQVVLQANGTTSLIVGGNGSSTTGNVTTTNLLASSTIVIGRYVSSYSNNQYNLMFDVNNHVMYPNHTSPMYAWSLGSSQHWFNELYAVNVHLGNNTTAAKIGFFGATPQAKKTGISTLDGLITALKGYGLIG